MSHHDLILYWSTVAFEILLCALVYLRTLASRLPLFSIYSGVLLVGTLCTGLAYWHFGFRSANAAYAFWICIAVDLLARSAAIVELCRNRLRAYRGIWAFAWRLLACMAVLFLAHAAWDAWSQPNWIIAYGLTIRRDIDVSSVMILMAMLLIRDYYGIPNDRLQKWLATGICFVCVIEIANYTVTRDLFIKYMSSWDAMGSQVQRVTDLWNTIQTFASISCIGIWCYALRRPLPALAQAPNLLPAEIYGALSPAMNLRLRAFNDRLLEMLKP